MTPTLQQVGKANKWMQDSCNRLFKKYSIPVQMVEHRRGETRTEWRVDYLDKSKNIEAIFDMLYAVQDTIINAGPAALTRDDALFMVVSHWFDWMISCEGLANHSRSPEIMQAMNFWMGMFNLKGGVMVN